MTTVVLGAIEVRKRTRLAGLHVFLASLRHHAPDVTVALVNRSPANPELELLLTRYHVESVAPTAGAAFSIEVGRFLDYGTWLAGRTADTVVLADVLDVAWQGHPMHLVTGTGLTVAQENIQIRACPFNSRWVREQLPEDDAADLLDWPATCCGVLAGRRVAVARYLSTYADRVAVFGRLAALRGFDTTTLLRYLSHSDGARLLPYANPAIAHLGYADPATTRWDGAHVWSAGRMAVAVHQYNRHPAVQTALEAKWI